jgi:hypothetical protein
MKVLYKLFFFAYQIIAMPLTVIVLIIWFFPLLKEKRLVDTKIIGDAVDYLAPHCFLITTLLCGFWYVFVVN